MIIYSYAKVNLFLRVINKRKDGFHRIETLFERIDLADKITIRMRKDGSVRIISNHPHVPKDASNLCYRSAQLLKKEFSLKYGADIIIRKNIPVGAGLGGGSSNAAATLLGLNKMWKLGLSRDRLAELGARIGSDVPFFIYGPSFALGSGRGEKIKPLPKLNKVRLWHLLAVPKIRVSTPLIYERWDSFSGLTQPKTNVKLLIQALGVKSPYLGRFIFNSLEPVTAEAYPAVRETRKRLAKIGLTAILMSGSGPAVFGLASSQKEAEKLGRKLSRSCRNCRVFAVGTR